MTPVLAVADPAAARRHLIDTLGFQVLDGDALGYGDQPIHLCAAGTPPPGLLPLRLDHLALRVDDVDAHMRRLLAHGGRLTAGFTPDGPVEIAAFWDQGVRFVFFDGPEGWPLEFCRPHAERHARPAGHDHFGIRSTDLDGLEAQLTDLGATPVAQHQLTGGAVPVDVRFLSLDNQIFEIFDEMPAPVPPRAGHGWIGLLP